MAYENMATRYDATQCEKTWYARWEEAGLFSPGTNPEAENYCITIPPPNITGSLHMGHALCYPIQDLLGRYQRLRGKNVLILPGQDHAGIATQSVVEKLLRKEGSSGAQIGREKFVERVWQWREESGSTILHQFRSFGCAFDWPRSRFTLDKDYADAVLRVFVDWFDRGIIFRGKRVVNWDPVLQTSVSDIETERKTVRGKLYYIAYPFADGSGSVTIATTRPETMLADVAVAVHPSDKRYEGKVGKTLVLPLLEREIPLIADLYPDPEFGSGAVKITPAHDPNDFLVGQRHGLPMPVLLDVRARVTEEGGKYAGLDRLKAREQVVADLEACGALVKVEDYDIPILVSERSGEVIEPLLSEQWFADQPKLAPAVIAAVNRGEIRFHPERYNRIFLDWLENIREWCISRQLWWGHRIPVWYDEDGNAFAGVNEAEAQAKSAKPLVRQDDDVLDTWFSSGLWPFATLGWPEATRDFEQYFPTQTLVTDRNIINLWVARMAMMSLDQTGQIPFSDVMIYATVLNEKGQRMSKSLGTGVDPMGIIEELGADALRWTLLSQTGDNQELRYSPKRTEEARNWANKIWNATRFVLMNAGAEPVDVRSMPDGLQPVDRWLLSRLAATEAIVREAYDAFDPMGACQALYRFFWSELCDWYIEVSKPRLSDPAQAAVPQRVLLAALDAFLRMLHPIMPFVTEELYSHLPVQAKAAFVMSAPWPTIPASWRDEAAETEIERVFEAVRALRALRAQVDLAAMKPIPAAFYEGELGGSEAILASQAWVQDLRKGRPDGVFLSTHVEGIDVYLPTEGLVDAAKEIEKADREIESLLKQLGPVEARLANPQFAEKAKPEVVAKERATADDLRARIAAAEDRKRMFS